MVLSFTIIGLMMAIRYLWQFNVVRQIKPSNLYRLSEKIISDRVHIFFTFFILVLGFMLFRVQAVVDTLKHKGVIVGWNEVAGTMYSNLLKLNEAGFLTEVIHHKGSFNFFLGIFFAALMLVAEGLTGDKFMEDEILKKKRAFRWSVYVFLFLGMMWFGVFNESEFVYFQY